MIYELGSVRGLIDGQTRTNQMMTMLMLMLMMMMAMMMMIYIMMSVCVFVTKNNHFLKGPMFVT